MGGLLLVDRVPVQPWGVGLRGSGVGGGEVHGIAGESGSSDSCDCSAKDATSSSSPCRSSSSGCMVVIDWQMLATCGALKVGGGPAFACGSGASAALG